MENRKGRRQHVSHTERSRHLMGLRPDVAAPPRFGNERPAVHGPQGVHRHGGSIHGQAAGPAPAEGAQIIKTSHVIHMGMRIKDGVHVRDMFPQGLLPQIRGGIQQEAGARGLHINRRTQPPVSGVRRRADRAGAAYLRHSGGRSCAQKENVHHRGHDCV